MRTYKISKPITILIYIAAPLLIALFTWLLLMPFLPGSKVPKNTSWFLVLVALGMIALLIVGLIDAIKYRFVIDTDMIYSIGATSNRQLRLDEIKGYRVNDKFIYIEPNTSDRKKIKISKYIGRKEEIIAWLASHFPELDEMEASMEREKILSSDEFGWSKEEREQKLKTARTVATTINIAGGLAAAWAFVKPEPYHYAIIACIAVPVLALIVLKWFKGLIKLSDKKNSAYPSIVVGILLPSFAVCLRALLDFNIFDYKHAWLLAIGAWLAFVAVLLVGNKAITLRESKDYGSLIVIVVILLGYSYGSVVTLNCMYDTSTAQIFNTTILSKHVSHGKSTTYRFELAPWGPQQEANKVDVSKTVYEEFETGNEVDVYFKKGMLGISWYDLHKK